MKIRTLVVLLLVIAFAGFAALNWHAFITPTRLDLVFAQVEAPLGIILLGVLAFVTALAVGYMLYLQSSVLLEARRHARELHANRELADQAEASRFTELSNLLKEEMAKMIERDRAAQDEIFSRLDRLEGTLLASVEDAGNSTAAYLGELDDRMERGSHGTDTLLLPEKP